MLFPAKICSGFPSGYPATLNLEQRSILVFFNAWVQASIGLGTLTLEGATLSSFPLEIQEILFRIGGSGRTACCELICEPAPLTRASSDDQFIA